MSRERIVIIGASLAGASAAAALREGGFDGELQLIGAESQPPYNRPPLSKGYLRGEERFEDQLVKPSGYYAEQSIGLRLRIRAAARAGGRALVVGLGFIGSEVAASLRQLGVLVAAVEGHPVPLARVLGAEVGEVLAGIHREKGVELVLEDSVAAFEGAGRV